MSEQLKPCPICGDRILLGVCASEHGEWSWECDNGDCFMQGVVEAASREEAIVKLNRRVQPVESAQQPCCGLCADECRLESAQQNEPNDDERVEYERLVKALRNAREAIARLDEDALGRDQREGWPYRDELLAEIDAAHRSQQKGSDNERAI